MIYKLTSKRLNGHIIATYTDGLLNSFEMHFKPPVNVAAFEAFKQRLSYHEGDIHNFESIGLVVTQQMPANEKIALFCRKYEQHRQLKYKASRADGGKIKPIELTEAMLDHYFTSENFLFKGKYSVSNLVKYYNELRDEMKNGTDTMPNEWNPSYANKLKSDQLPKYWAHLRSLGLTPKKDSANRTIDWVKPEQLENE